MKLPSFPISPVYLILIVLLILTVIFIFIKISSLQNNINNFNEFKDDINSFKGKISDLDLKNTLEKLKLPNQITYAGGDGDVPLKPSDVITMIQPNNIGIIQQHLDLPDNYGYGNVLTFVPSNNIAYISQIWLGTIYNNSSGVQNKMYIRYSQNNFADIKNGKDSESGKQWTSWYDMATGESVKKI
jgi:hypothetical protein